MPSIRGSAPAMTGPSRKVRSLASYFRALRVKLAATISRQCFPHISPAHTHALSAVSPSARAPSIFQAFKDARAKTNH